MRRCAALVMHPPQQKDRTTKPKRRTCIGNAAEYKIITAKQSILFHFSLLLIYSKNRAKYSEELRVDREKVKIANVYTH